MKWMKDDFFSALKSKSFEQFRASTQTPSHPLCNCYSIPEAPAQAETEFDKYLRHRVSENASPPLPSRLPSLSTVPVFRPEPIFPSSATTTNNKRSPPNMYYTKQNEDNLPMPYNKVESRRSAFTIASLADAKDPNLKNRYLPPSNSTSSTSSSASPPPNYKHEELNNNSSNSSTTSIPVIYTTSNKKRKKNTSETNRQYNANPTPSLPTQQVNTAPRTYYEVDRDTHGAYILPVEIDSWTVVDLGTVIYDRPAYHNQRYIYPANYTVRK
jgi:hypothetical protein